MANELFPASELTRNVPAKHLEPLKGGKVPIEILVRGKDAEQNGKHFEKCLDVIKGAGVRYIVHWPLYRSADIFLKKVGVIAKDASSGPFADEWKKAYGDISKDVEEVDISLALSGAAFAVKDENELVGPPIRIPVPPGRSLMLNSGICEMPQGLVRGFYQSSSLRRCQESWMQKRR